MVDQTGKTSWKLSGEPISSGIAIGEAFLFRQINLDALEKTKFPVDDIDKEFERLESMVRKTIAQLQEIIDQKNLASAVAEIFQAQLRMLQDAGFIQELKSMLDMQKANIEYVLSNQINAIEHKFRALGNELLRTRFLDIQDVYYRVLRNCLDIEHVRSNPFQRVQAPVIFIAQKLLPSDLALLDYDKLLAVLMEEGSSVSHVAIIAKALGIPAIIKIPGISSIARAHDMIIADANRGIVIVNPSESAVASYAQTQRPVSPARPKALKRRNIPECATIDGVGVTLEANIGSLKEAHEALDCGAAGIGLLRSELFYLSQSGKPTIKDESDYYAEVFSLFKNRPITIRLLDLGADKNLPYLRSFEEENPQLGTRGIRYLLHNKDLFQNHLKSIMRANATGSLKILIPFVAVEDDVAEARKEIEAVSKQENIDPSGLKLGIMVEIPSAALSLSRFWPHIDFVNIGTNDLAQYVFAASREDGNVESYRKTSHPVILKLLALCAASGKRVRKSVSVCGELAADPQGALLLVGLGIRSLSMQPSSIPIVRKAINESSFKNLQKLAKKALSGRDFQERI
jgi:phosphoenolpyruvate-protein phosphotransferase (PTS system enzyme I)